MRRDTYKPELRARAKDLYRSGKSVRGVAKAMGLSSTRAYQLLRQSGARMRTKGRPRLKKKGAR